MTLSIRDVYVPTARASWIGAAAQLACLLEAAAPKPGNVSPGRHFRDTRYEHFLASAAAIGAPMAQGQGSGLGRTIRAAVEATSAWTASNTNLGIVLLLSPLAHAAHVAALESIEPYCVAPPALRTSVLDVLGATIVEDAREVYAAIRLASPGGLGRVPEQDVSGEPSQSLLEVMRLAAGRDTIASEYASGFAVTFDMSWPALRTALDAGLSWDDAIVETFLTVLASRPDSHIARRAGAAAASEASARAAAALASGGVRTADGRHTIAEMDREMRCEGNTMNPGTTADLMAAAIFVELLGGGWHRRRQHPDGRA